MKIALDPTPFHHDFGLLDSPKLSAQLGYEHPQLTPHRDFIPFYNHPRADEDAREAAVRNRSGSFRSRSTSAST